MKKPNGQTESFQLRFPAELLADLEEFASRDGRSIANLVRKICADYVAAQRAKEPRESLEAQ